MIHLDALRCFCAVVDAASFRVAAERLHRTQPAVSQRVRGLEKECGETLLDRRSRRPTATGRIVYERGLDLLRAAERLEAEVKEKSGKGAGELRIGTSDTNALYFLPERVRAFARKMPKVRVFIHCRSSDEVADAVLKGDLDLGIVTLPLDRAELEVQPLFDQRLVLVAPRRHALATRKRVTLDDLRGQPMVLIQSETRTGGLLRRHFAEHSFAPNTIMDSGSFEVIKQYVAEGIGVSILPEMTLRKDDLRRLAPIQMPGLPRVAIGAVWPRGGYESAASQTFKSRLLRK
jgi:DNA-binding transcriptional LysR family regulator